MTTDSLAELLRASGLDGGGLTSIAEQLQQLKASNDTLTRQMIAAMTPAVSGGEGGGDSILSTIGGALGGVLSGGFGLEPLISGLVGIFGGVSDSSALPILPTYVPPLPIHLDAGFSEAGGGPFAIDAGQGGAPREIANASAPQITIQVNAMDSKSFLDHSQDIAMAVRQAMLETTMLNDVIREV